MCSRHGSRGHRSAEPHPNFAPLLYYYTISFSSIHSNPRITEFFDSPALQINYTLKDESPRTPPIRTTPLRIQPRIRHPRRRRSRHHRPAGLEREENHRASMRRCWRSKRPSQEDITQGASPRAAPSTPSTPPASAVVRELREAGDATMHRVWIEYLWCAVCNQAVEAAPTRMQTAAGGGTWGGVCEGG